MKIDINSENIDDFYEKINSLIDNYFEWKISPMALKKYLKAGSVGIKKFIERNDLGNIRKIDKIILDVVEDRSGMDMDGVFKFENFSIDLDNSGIEGIEGNDFILSNNIEPSNIEYEKIIADKYRTSLGLIEELDTSNHSYSTYTKYIIVFSDEDIQIIKNNLSHLMTDYIYNYDIKMGNFDLSIKLSDFLTKSEISDRLDIDKDKVIKNISEILQNGEYSYSYDGEFRGYHFWIF